MSDLTETEIFSTLIENLKIAIQASDDLTTIDRRGPAYQSLRTALGLIEGCCRQASAWREDTRWLTMGLVAAECLKRSGGWLRGYRDEQGGKVTYALTTKNQMFAMLAENLRFFLKGVETLRDQKTGRVGMILPDVPLAQRRQGAPISVSGLILPKAPRPILLN